MLHRPMCHEFMKLELSYSIDRTSNIQKLFFFLSKEHAPTTQKISSLFRLGCDILQIFFQASFFFTIA